MSLFDSLRCRSLYAHSWLFSCSPIGTCRNALESIYGQIKGLEMCLKRCYCFHVDSCNISVLTAYGHWAACAPSLHLARAAACLMEWIIFQAAPCSKDLSQCTMHCISQPPNLSRSLDLFVYGVLKKKVKKSKA